ncbi:MAG: capsule assembly Wzi family protein [Nitrospinota bacterium]
MKADSRPKPEFFKFPYVKNDVFFRYPWMRNYVIRVSPGLLILFYFLLNPLSSHAVEKNDISNVINPKLQFFAPTPRSSGTEFKLLHSLSTKIFVGNEENSFIEGRSGLSLKKGLNFFFFEDGYVSFENKAFLYFQVKQRKQKGRLRNTLQRLYSKLHFGKFSLLLGKDNFNMGHGAYGLLVSNNAEPYPVVLLRTEKPLNLFGDWTILFFNGWLTEEREDVSNPQILGGRVSWKPWSFIEFGFSKTEFYGGDGRPGYTLPEYYKLLTGSEDNVKGKFDNDGNASWDVAISLPVNRWSSEFTLLKMFYQRAGTDIMAAWQKEDKESFKFPFEFRLLHVSNQGGILLSGKRDLFRIEYARTAHVSFTHHFYNIEGQTFNGLSIGYPYGRDIQSLFFRHRHYFLETATVEYTLGALEKPTSRSYKMRRYYITLEGAKRFGDLTLGWYLRGEQTENYNRNPVPSQVAVLEDTNRFLFTTGFSVSWTL